MAISYGKSFELKVREDLSKIDGISVDRLYDQTGKYYGVRNISDLIVYKFPFMVFMEVKSHKGNTFPLENLTQYERLITKKGIKGIKAGAVIWFVEKDAVLWVPIESFEQMKVDGLKSVNVLTTDREKYNIFTIPSIKKRVFMDSDYSKLFELWEAELNGRG